MTQSYDTAWHDGDLAVPEFLPKLLDEHDASSVNGLSALNDAIRDRTGIRNFFPSRKALDRFRHNPERFLPEKDALNERQWGDFQTPRPMAERVCELLADIGVHPRVVIEPTYGAGSFIEAALAAFPSAELFYGVEIQRKYEWELKLRLALGASPSRRWSGEIELRRGDIFTHRFPSHISASDDLLILGNPPWVTNAELGTLRSENRPTRRNIKALNGLDALTGRSNFDLSECVILKMLELFSMRRGWLAMLCKSGVARNIVESIPQCGFACSDARVYGFNAADVFGAAVDASLLVIHLGERARHVTCSVRSLDAPDETLRTFGWAGEKFVADRDLYGAHAFLDGASPAVWRQGIKHDCAPVMELREEEGRMVNGDGEEVSVEREWIYPLLKSSDLRSFVTAEARRGLIVTQHHIGDDTAPIAQSAPRLWAYLESHREQFERRRSSIYRKAPPFALFGVGDYSFKPYKVGIAGLYKRPLFSLILPIDGRPVMLDDTCYSLGFDTLTEALFTASILNHPMVLRFLDAIVFPDAKRPYTKSALMRIDLVKAADALSFEELESVWREHGYVPPGNVVVEEYEKYRGRNHLLIPSQ